MVWYYAEGGTRMGPFEDGDFQRLVAQGRILATTLVWREGMPAWQTFQQVAEAYGADLAPGQTAVGGVCSQCGRYSATDDMIRFRGAWVCAGCKPVFFQRLREGETAPGVMTALRYAGFWIRFGAAFIDGVILVVAWFIVGYFFDAVSSSASPLAQAGLAMLNFFTQVGIGIYYGTHFVGRYGGTPGLLACGLRVVVSDGSRVGYARAFGRAWAQALNLLIVMVGVMTGTIFGLNSDELGLVPVLAVIGGVLMGFGYYMAAFDSQKRALHDHICNTRVIWR